MRRAVDTCGWSDNRHSLLGPRGLVALLLLLLVSPAGAQVVPPGGFAGRSLAAVLQALQARGLRIVFTSNIVTSDMRVRVEPRALSLRRQLDEILAPHGLMAREGPGGTLQIVRAPALGVLTAVRPPPKEEAEAGATPAPLGSYNEWITVVSSDPWSQRSGVSEATANHRDLIVMPGSLVDDPLQAIHSMPRVAPLGDFRSEFVVRASPFRHAEVVLDGVSTSWLRHAPDSSASVSMFTSQLLDSATLRAGAYPRTYGDHLGPQLELTLREGSRDRLQVTGALANTAATLVAEGPIGQSRGSWIAAARQSLLEWPGEHLVTARPVFTFSDALGKLVFDVGARHQLGVTLLTGTSRVDTDEEIESEPVTQASARTSVVNMTWRSTVGSTNVITHRVYLVASSPPIGIDQEVVYRPTLVRRSSAGLWEMGAQFGRTAWRRGTQSATAWTRSGYLSLRSQMADRVTVSPGIRVSGASHTSGAAITPWLAAELPVRRRWTIAASTGLSHQFPEVGRAYGLSSSDRLRPERAIHLDISVRQQLTASVRWQATLYQRRERSFVDGRQPFSAIDLVSAVGDNHNETRLAGSARGLEIVVERQSTGGLSGWVAHSYGWAQQTDADRGETFWADFDQRHAITAFGAYRWPDTTSLGATLRIGSGVPIPGYLSSRGRNLFAGERRNEVRLSPYARLDVRADRTFRLGGPRVQAFVEVVNLLNRANTGATAGTFGLAGEAIGFIERLSPRRASAGMTVGF